MYRTLVHSLSLALILATQGCGGGTSPAPDPQEPACDETKKGYTDCDGSTRCQPGQYCMPPDEWSQRSCGNGCLSDANCGCNQQCLKAGGQNVGTCSAPNQPPSMIRCGDGTCSAGETSATCPADCPATARCGDGVCSGGETTQTCAADCPAAARCGDNQCSGDETAATCPQDCPDVDHCRRECDSYDFFKCFAAGELQSCYDRCHKASVAQINQFTHCAGNATINCDTSCLADLP